MGETFVTLNGLIMAAYMQRYGVPHAAFAPFAVLAHANAMSAEHATLKLAVDAAAYEASRMLSPPIQLLDASPVCDGAAAIVLTSARATPGGRARVRLAGSAAATDTLAVRARPDMCALPAVSRSTADALQRAGLQRSDVQLFEVHDAYAIMAAACLEAGGWVPPGEATAAAAEGAFARGGSLPIATFGGLKARGHPVGATGVYQAAEVHRQLTARAGDNQVPGARVALTQNVGGSGVSVFTHAFVVE